MLGREGSHKGRALFMLAVALFLAGCAVFFVGSFDPLYQAASGVLIIGSVYLLRISYVRSETRREVYMDGTSAAAKRSGPRSGGPSGQHCPKSGAHEDLA